MKNKESWNTYIRIGFQLSYIDLLFYGKIC